MRIKRGTTTHQRHKKLRQQTKGMTHMRKASPRMARQAIFKALQYGYRDRRNKKRDFKKLWITRINAAARLDGLSYSRLMQGLKKANIQLDRKILSELAVNYPKAFSSIAKRIKK